MSHPFCPLVQDMDHDDMSRIYACMHVVSLQGSDDGKSPNLSHWPSRPGSEAADSVDEPCGSVVPNEHLCYLRHWISKEDERPGAPPSRAR